MSQIKTKFLENSSVTDAKVSTGIDAAKIADGSVSNAEFQFINSVTSNVQTQINGKQATGNYVTSLTGDVTGSGPGATAATLATVNSNVGTFGSVNTVSQVTVNAKGLITAAIDRTISITEGQVVNLPADLAAKLSNTLTNAHVFVGNGSNVATDVAVSGDVTLANTGAVTIANDAVTFAKIQNIATDSLIGRDTAGSGDPETILLNATLSMDGSNNLQRAALTGDVTASAGSNATTVANDAVTFAKMQNIATDSLIGRDTAGSGDPEAILLNATLSMDGSNNLQRAALTGDVTASAGSNATTIANLAVTNAKIANTTIDLTTKVTGALPIANGGTGQTAKAAAFDALSPMTTGGDLIYGGASGTGTRLANGTSGQVLTSNGTTTAPSWQSAPTPALTSAHLFVGNGSNVATDVAASGDLTLANTGAFTIANNAVTNAKIANTTIDLTTKVTGALPIANGGSGQTTKTDAFDALAPTTTKGDIIVYNGSDNVRLAASTDGTFVKYDSSTATGLAAGTPASTGAYRSVTATDSPSATTDYILKCSGASFTITLPTAVGNSGKMFVIEHTGTSLTQLYTLATTSSQTIGGIAGGSYILYTNGETLTIYSDGANWQIMAHRTDTDWTDVGATIVTATTTNPTKASTITTDKMYWRRRGNQAEIRMQYVQSNTTSAAAGSGDYLWQIPNNMTIDTTNMTVFTTVVGGNTAASYTNTMGSASGRFATSQPWNGPVIVYDSSNVRYYALASTGLGMISSTTSFNFVSVNFTLVSAFSVPISGWQP